MKKPSNLLMLLLLALVFSCSSSEDADVDGKNPDPDPDPVESVVYELVSANESGVTGTATLLRNEDGTSTIYIELENALEGVHPARVHDNNFATDGPVAITLEDCECAISETVITQKDNGQAISFDQLMVFDGHIKIFQASVSAENIIAYADIGSNAF